MPEISIIIPVYNISSLLHRCLKSILNQTFQDFEVICVNDCSMDDSLAILERYAEKYQDKIRIVTNDVNVGLGQTRDNGMKYASGRYVVFIDADDCIRKDYLEVYHAKITGDDSDVVLGGYILVKNKKKKLCNRHMSSYMHWLWPTAWARMYRREFLLEHDLDFQGIRLYEDEPFTYRVMASGPKTSYVDYCGYYYVINPKSLTMAGEKGSRAASFDRYMEVIRKLVQDMREYSLSEEDFEIYEFGIVSGLIANALYNGKSSGKEKIMEIYDTCFSFLKEYFPEYRKNRYFKLWNLPRVEIKKRVCTFLVVFLQKFGLDRLFFRGIGAL